MVCELLMACGTYFSEGRAASKLDRFLTFFQVCATKGGLHAGEFAACLLVWRGRKTETPLASTREFALPQD
jgi:hypothetical protein